MSLQTKILVNLFNLPYYDNIQKLPSYINDNCFGVFATIRRYTKLDKFPEDIHGCIGYWDDDYKSLSSEFIISKLKEVSYDAMYNDDRHSYFPNIINDPLSLIELDFMMLPIISITASNGLIKNKKFKNSDYGIIATNKNSRATYLPNVFPDTIPWDDLKKSIKQKANINNNNNIETNYYGYKIEQLSISIWSLLSTTDYRNYLFQQYIKTIEKYLLQNGIVPYSSIDNIIINKKNNKIITLSHNDNEYVRNLSVIESLLIYKYNCLKNNISNKTNQKINIIIYKLIQNIYTKINKNIKNDNLTLSGLISLLCTWNNLFPLNKILIEKKKVIDIIKNISIAERDFEFGQIILAVLKYSPKLLIQYVSIEKILQNIINYQPSLELIFRMNWDSQVLVSLYNNIKNSLTIKIKKCVLDMCYRYVKLLDSISEDKLNELETNQLAVLFEGFFNLINTLDKKIQYKFCKYCFKLFIIIMSRWNNINGLLVFKDNSIRVDITVHFLDALSKIINKQ